MDDPRTGLGYDVHDVEGPFRVHKPTNTGGELGGTLDRAIVGHVDGREAVVGEVWARCPNGTEDGARVDSVAFADRIVEALNAVLVKTEGGVVVDVRPVADAKARQLLRQWLAWFRVPKGTDEEIARIVEETESLIEGSS